MPTCLVTHSMLWLERGYNSIARGPNSVSSRHTSYACFIAIYMSQTPATFDPRTKYRLWLFLSQTNPEQTACKHDCSAALGPRIIGGFTDGPNGKNAVCNTLLVANLVVWYPLKVENWNRDEKGVYVTTTSRTRRRSSSCWWSHRCATDCASGSTFENLRFRRCRRR